MQIVSMPELRFSIVVACYNQEKFVKVAVESALSQEHPSKEVIVVDDCSQDGTAEVLRTFGASIIFARLPINRGADAARNHGASLASGKYLVFLDGDDVLMPWTLQVYERLIAAESPKIILGRRFKFQGEVPRAAGEVFPRNIDFVNYEFWLQKDRTIAFGASSFVIQRQTFWNAGGWSPGVFHLDMTDLLLKLGLSGKVLVILAPDTVWYRIHSSNVTHAVAQILRCAKVLLKKERAGEYPGGRKYSFARSTCLGGPMLSWILIAVGKGLFLEAIKLAGSGWFTILSAIVRRFIALCGGRRPVQSVELAFTPPGKSRTA
jgi:glycosyltransferase involved in cell wall biosynthesis